MTGIFYHRDCSIFHVQSQRQTGPGLENICHRNDGNKQTQLQNSFAALEKQTELIGKLNKVMFSSQPKTHFFGDILLEQHGLAPFITCSRVRGLSGFVM